MRPIVPSFLAPGDCIALICPAGFMAAEDIQTCIDTLQDWGYKVRRGHTIGGDSKNYFSGTDDQRRMDFQEMLDDPGVKAILFGRGGYGMTRIIEQIDFSAFTSNPKWLIGYSDITILHGYIHTNYNIVTLHSPMAGAFNNGGADTVYLKSLKQILAGGSDPIVCAPHPFNKYGSVTGPLLGGNLSLLAHGIGTSSDIITNGALLFLEDVGEYYYKLDRMLYQLRRSGKLSLLKGLIVGGFTEMNDTQRPFGADAEEIIRDIVNGYDYPVCFGFPVGHGINNYPLKIGAGYTLQIDADQTRLAESF